MVLIALHGSVGCSAYRAIPLTHMTIPRELRPEPGAQPPRIRVRRNGDAAWVNMQVERIEGPVLLGMETTGDPPTATTHPLRVDIRTVTTLEVYLEEARQWRTVGIGTSVFAGVLTVIGLVVVVVALASKSSCPFVFVETPDGVRLVGEAYSGSTSRAIQRDDLLELPPLAGPTARLSLANHADETQYTDRVELQLVAHDADTRAVAGADARPMLVGAPRAPERVTTLDGRVIALPASDEGSLWQSDMERATRSPEAPLRDGLDVTFAAPSAGATPVLELDVANTYWADVVLGRMFAAFGDGLEAHLTRQDLAASADAQRAWREREGINLSVEVFREGAWRSVGRVPTPGPAAVRRVAMVLPRGPAGEPLRVRLSAGTGFWRIGTLALSELREAQPVVVRVPPSRAIQPDGTDARSQLAATDGNHQALPRRGDRLALEFALPEAPSGRARTAFLFASGYYRVHAQPQASRSVGTLRRLRDEPGSMVRFGFDLYREYARVIREAPASAP
jgi:hypothetical protein